MPFDLPAPLNSILWTFGSVAVLFFAIRNWIEYRKSHNEFTKAFALFSFILTVSLVGYGLPGMFTSDNEIILYGYILGEVFFFSSMLFQAKILWFVLLRQKIPLWPLILFVVGCGVTAVYGSAVAASTEVVNQMVIYDAPIYTDLARVAVSIGLLMPIGYYFLLEANRREQLIQKLKPFSLGLAYFGIGAAITYRDIFTNGEDTVPVILMIMVFFGLFFISMTLRNQSRD